MKKVLAFVTIFVFLFGSMVFAQDTLVVSTALNSLIDEVAADTSASGEQLHDVYKLIQDENYTIDKTAVYNNPIVLVSDPCDYEDADKKPPVVRVVTKADGTPSATLYFLVGANFTVKNIYFAGMGTADVWMSGNWLNPSAPDISIRVDGCIFDYMGWSIIANFAHEGISYYADNVYIKNNINSGDPYSPFWVLTSVPVDTFYAKNCTMFQSHGFFMQARNTVNYVEIDHCTIANDLKMPFFNENLCNARFTNNVFYNTTAIGETAAEAADKDRDGLWWSIVNVDTLPGNEAGATTPAPMPEADRNIYVANNAYFWTQEVQDFWADNIFFGDVWMNARTQAMFDNDTDWPGLVEENNINVDPGFEYIGNANELMYQYMNAFRGISGSTFIWGFEEDQDEWPDLYRVMVEWPLAEDLEHNITMLGTDGQPLGDLNWFALVTGVEDNGEVVARTFELKQNYPNPFNPTTYIKYSVLEKGHVELKVFNVLGAEVATLVNKTQIVGNYKVTFDAMNLTSGVYFYQLKAGDQIITRKMVLMK